MTLTLTDDEAKIIRNAVLYIYDHSVSCVDKAKLWEINKHLFSGDKPPDSDWIKVLRKSHSEQWVIKIVNEVAKERGLK